MAGVMNKTNRIQLNSMKRAKQFVMDHPILPPKLAATAAINALGLSITSIEALASSRNEGTGMFRGASRQRQLAKSELYLALSHLSSVAKTLDPIEYPDIAEQLKMRRHRRTYQTLLNFARAVVAVVESIQQVFIDHGSAETLMDDLNARIAALASATARQATGLGSQIGKTRAITIEARNGMKQVRKLDSILSQIYQPELLAAWKAAKRLERTLPAEEKITPPQPAA